jgi:hypothetical protein
VANPGGEKIVREASWIHVGKFAKQIELAFSYDVHWIGDGEVITDVFVLDLIFHNMVHVDSDDSANGGVLEGRYFSAEWPVLLLEGAKGDPGNFATSKKNCWFESFE